MLRHQEWEEHDVAAYDTEQVDIDDAMPCLDRYRFNGSHGEHADVVHDDIDLTEGIERAVAQRGEVLVASDIAAARPMPLPPPVITATDAPMSTNDVTGREVTTIAAHKSTRHVVRTTFSAMVKVRSTLI